MITPLKICPTAVRQKGLSETTHPSSYWAHGVNTGGRPSKMFHEGQSAQSHEKSNSCQTIWTSDMWLPLSDYYDIKSSYSAAAVVSDQLRFHGEALTDVSHYEAWRGCSGRRCSAEAGWPLCSCCLVNTQLIWGDSEVFFEKGTPRSRCLVRTSPLSRCGSLYCAVGLARWQRGLFPSRKHIPTSHVTTMPDETRRHSRKILLQPNPSGAVFNKVVK